MSKNYNLTHETSELLKQLSIDEVLNDCLNAESEYQEWKERRARSKKLLEYKIREHDDTHREVTTHEDSDTEIEQLTLDLGDYQVRSRDKVSKRFDKNQYFDQISVEHNNSRVELQRFQPTDEDYLQSLDKDELVRRLQNLERQVVETKKEVYDNIEEIADNATKFNVYKETEPILLKNKSKSKTNVSNTHEQSQDEEKLHVYGA